MRGKVGVLRFNVVDSSLPCCNYYQLLYNGEYVICKMLEFLVSR